MKRNLLLFCCILTLLCPSGCAKGKSAQLGTDGSEPGETAAGPGEVRTEAETDQSENGKDRAEEEVKETGEDALPFENGKGYYILEADADTTVTPAIEFDGTDGTFMFLYDILLSRNIQGTFKVKDNILTAKASDGKGKYRFEIESGDVLRFVQKGSSEIMLSDADSNEKYLADKAKFIREEHVMPTKEEVYAMRQRVLEGMTDEAVKTLTDNIKSANESLERSCIHGNLFERLSDPENLTWNLLEKTGEVQTDWAFEDGMEYDRSSGLTYGEFGKKYGMPVMTDNQYDADDLIGIVQQMKDSLKNNLLKSDLENIIQNINYARETHDVEYVKKIYYALHDMDYFLLRYGIEDIGKHISDMSAVSAYYGALEVYQ